MVFTVTDLGGVFHLRTVGRSNDMYSGCTTVFNLFFMSGKSSTFNCVRCTLPEKSSGPYSSGSDFTFVFDSSILQTCSCPFRASLQLIFRVNVLYCCFSVTSFSVVSAWSCCFFRDFFSGWALLFHSAAFASSTWISASSSAWFSKTFSASSAVSSLQRPSVVLLVSWTLHPARKIRIGLCLRCTVSWAHLKTNE